MWHHIPEYSVVAGTGGAILLGVLRLLNSEHFPRVSIRFGKRSRHDDGGEAEEGHGHPRRINGNPCEFHEDLVIKIDEGFRDLRSGMDKVHQRTDEVLLLLAQRHSI